uniref:Uncharacterized protein n=1 Tax=Anguilla anguilla TaxID=7936 RepID=A0A0E9VEG1_ANGAN
MCLISLQCSCRPCQLCIFLIVYSRGKNAVVQN